MPNGVTKDDQSTIGQLLLDINRKGILKTPPIVVEHDIHLEGLIQRDWKAVGEIDVF